MSDNYRSLSGLFLFLLMHGALVASLPVLDSAAPGVTPNTIEENDKLPDTKITSEHDLAPVIVPGLDPIDANGTHQEIDEGVAEAQDKLTPFDNVASASSIDPAAMYASSFITPDALQQYLSQYGAAAAYGPYVGPYPAPIAAAPGLYPYPGPLVVQTGFEGYLVPSTTSASTTDVTATTAAPSASNPLMTFITRLLPTILMSTLFRIAAVVLSAVGVVLFGGAITNALCRLTPICDIPNKAVDYLRSGGAEDVGRMLAEEMTPERVRRATQFVRNAIRKYRQLQKLVEEEAQTEKGNSPETELD